MRRLSTFFGSILTECPGCGQQIHEGCSCISCQKEALEKYPNGWKCMVCNEEFHGILPELMFDHPVCKDCWEFEKATVIKEQW